MDRRKELKLAYKQTNAHQQATLDSPEVAIGRVVDETIDLLYNTPNHVSRRSVESKTRP